MVRDHFFLLRGCFNTQNTPLVTALEVAEVLTERCYVCRSQSMYLITCTSGLISSLATNSKAQRLLKHSMSSITAHMKVFISFTF